MSWPRAGGLSMLALGLISFILLIVFGWDISLQMLALQRQFLAENWILLITSFGCFFVGTLLIGSE